MKLRIVALLLAMALLCAVMPAAMADVEVMALPEDARGFDLHKSAKTISYYKRGSNYYCLMDVLDESFQLAVDKALKDCNTYHDWVKGFRSFLELLARYKQVALHVYHSSHQDELIAMIRKNGEMLVRRGIEECSRDMGTAVSPKDEDFMLKFYMNVFIGVVESFMNGRMEESPEYLASRCDAMMRHHIRHTLENLQKLEDGEF